MPDPTNPFFSLSQWKLICPSRPGLNVNPNVTGLGMVNPGNAWTFLMDWQGWNLSRVERPSTTVFWADSVHFRIRYNTTDRGTRYSHWQAWGEDITLSPSTRVAYRHNDGANCLFFDGHVEWRHHTTLAEDKMPFAQWSPIWTPYASPGADMPTYPFPW